MSEPIALDESAFFEFVARPEPSVVFLCIHSVHPFNTALPGRFQAASGASEIPFGSIELLELVVKRSPVLAFLYQSIESLGASSWPSVLPGYYLFADGQLLTWSSGLPIRDDATHIVRGAALGAVWYGLTGNRMFVGRAALFAANEASAKRIGDDFAAALRQHHESPRQATRPGKAASQHELQWAYELLGVNPGSSETEVNTAWRRLRARHHPDRASSDPVEFERRSKLSRELNRARDIVLAARQGAKRRNAA